MSELGMRRSAVRACYGSNVLQPCGSFPQPLTMYPTMFFKHHNVHKSYHWVKYWTCTARNLYWTFQFFKLTMVPHWRSRLARRTYKWLRDAKVSSSSLLWGKRFAKLFPAPSASVQYDDVKNASKTFTYFTKITLEDCHKRNSHMYS